VDRRTFDRDGFAVLPGAVPTGLCADLVEVINEYLGVDSNTDSWYSRPRPFLDLVPIWGHPSQWAIRQLPALHEAWSELWGTHNLLVSLDRCRFTPPWRDGEPMSQPIHWDHDPHDRELSYIQGVVALTDTGIGQGGFRCIPGWHRQPERWPGSSTPSTMGDEWLAAAPNDDIVSVPMKTGDVVLWSSRLPHSNSNNEGGEPRYAFYLQMVHHTEEFARELSECWETGACQGAWRELPGHQHLEPWAPAPLGDLGRKLVGLDSW
jgi:hypothetical protein